jgi:hypothetical protein
MLDLPELRLFALRIVNAYWSPMAVAEWLDSVFLHYVQAFKALRQAVMSSRQSPLRAPRVNALRSDYTLPGSTETSDLFPALQSGWGIPHTLVSGWKCLKITEFEPHFG